VDLHCRSSISPTIRATADQHNGFRPAGRRSYAGRSKGRLIGAAYSAGGLLHAARRCPAGLPRVCPCSMSSAMAYQALHACARWTARTAVAPCSALPFVRSCLGAIVHSARSGADVVRACATIRPRGPRARRFGKGCGPQGGGPRRLLGGPVPPAQFRNDNPLLSKRLCQDRPRQPLEASS